MPPRKKSRSRRRPTGSTTIRVAGILSQGSPIVASEEEVTIPADRIETGEIVFRIAGNFPDVGLADRDLLIVEPRPDGNAATGEFVVATLQELAFVGRWWNKHGGRTLLDNEFREIVLARGFQVLGAITLIARGA